MPVTPPFAPRPSAASPPCWCGLAPSDHANRSGAAPDHEYVPADGFESEAYDAW
jgi:hypothetical protein